MWRVGLLLAVALCSTCLARDYTFTIRLARGTSECFYDYIHEGAFLEIEYQVLCWGNWPLIGRSRGGRHHEITMLALTLAQW